jgi:hypothetical protein
MSTQIPFDVTDPAVVILTWLLAYAFKNLVPTRKARHLIPALAVLIAVAIRAVIGAIEGEPFTTALVLRALAAAAVAVFTNAQFRELSKLGEFIVDEDGAPVERKVKRAKAKDTVVPPEERGRKAEGLPEGRKRPVTKPPANE